MHFFCKYHKTIYLSETHGKKTWGTPFTSTWMGQQPDCNCGCEVLILHDPWSLLPESSAGPGTGLEPRIRPRIGAINGTPEWFHENTRIIFLSPAWPHTPPYSFAHALSLATDRRKSMDTHPCMFPPQCNTNGNTTIKIK